MVMLGLGWGKTLELGPVRAVYEGKRLATVKVKGQGQACARKAWKLAGSVGSLVWDALVGLCHGRNGRKGTKEADKVRGRRVKFIVSERVRDNSVSQFHSNERCG